MIVRLVIILIAPPILLWTFVSEFWREVKSAPWFAWNACMMEMDQVRAAWRSKSLKSKDWVR